MPKLISESLVPTGPDELELRLRFQQVSAAEFHALHEAIRQAAADGKFTLDEDTSIALALVALLSPDVSARLGYVATVIRMALADGRINLPEGFMIASAIGAAASGK